MRPARLLASYRTLKRALALFVCAVTFCPAKAASPTLETTIGERVRSKSERVLAPCCWREPVSLHHSPAAENVRQNIAARVSTGQSDDEIIEALVRENGKQILREPEGVQRQWLSWMPIMSVMFAIAFLVRFVRRSAAVMPLAGTTSLGTANGNLEKFLEDE